MKPMQIRLPRPVTAWLLARLAIPAGTVVTPPPVLGLTGRSLLYFKAKGCVACSDIDLFIARLARRHGLDLRVIDASPGLPEGLYGGELLHDSGGALRRAYRVRGFPTFVITGPGGAVEHASLGGEADEALMERQLGLG